MPDRKNITSQQNSTHCGCAKQEGCHQAHGAIARKTLLYETGNPHIHVRAAVMDHDRRCSKTGKGAGGVIALTIESSNTNITSWMP
jgi:hypothetical protein